ncbi:hypothetical protein [Rhizobium sp. NRK18]|uniref:hypothetical protein n=1 Tax=Rhizobium sp. NRK18 TaxID=2964667 RepID=UPI0021C35E24|nr:hypothetical protein [Rhizobium sp. NRK18]MCQ2006458.1 hypothetical protein [Rhizobium sp. NRK18]
MRQTGRKKLILEILNSCEPQGICLLNELRVKCAWAGEFDKMKSRKTDQKKSFNRTVIGNFDELVKEEVAQKYRGFYTYLSIGLFARWAVWELLEQEYLTGLPQADEMEIFVGRDACTAFVKLQNGQRSVVGTSVFMSDIILIGSREISDDDLNCLAQIPWPTNAFFEHGMTEDKTFRLCDAARLPSFIEFSNGTTASTARKRYSKY